MASTAVPQQSIRDMQVELSAQMHEIGSLLKNVVDRFDTCTALMSKMSESRGRSRSPRLTRSFAKEEFPASPSEEWKAFSDTLVYRD